MSAERGEAIEGTDNSRDGSGSYLTMRVVEYPDAADRCTVYPPGLGDHERMTHWISADRQAFVSLDLRR